MRTVNPRFMVEPMPWWRVPAAGFRAVIDVNLVTANIPLAGGATGTGMIPEDPADRPAQFTPPC
jgi:hypothetical protein